MKPLIHAKASVKKYGGALEDYLPVHEFIDHSKSSFPDVRHRALLHSSWGIYVVQQVFGPYLTLGTGKQVSTRDIAEDHVIQDLGFIPTVQDWLEDLPLKDWMGGSRKYRTRVMSFNQEEGEKVEYVD